MEVVDITPTHKKGKKDVKDNYRPLSILLVSSKIFEKSFFMQTSDYLKTFSTNKVWISLALYTIFYKHGGFLGQSQYVKIL